MSEDQNCLTLRPLPTAPWLRLHPELGRSLLDLSELTPPGELIEAVTLDGAEVKHRITGDHPHIFSVPYFRPEGQRLTIHTRCPQDASERPRMADQGSRNTKVAMRTIEAPRRSPPPEPIYGLSPRGAA